MQDHEMRAYLGDAYDDTTPEQRDRIAGAAAAIDARWPDPDLADTRTDAMSAALEVILGDTTPEAVAAEWHQARAVERAAHARLTGAIVALAGEPETHISDRLSVTRPTVRKALGKR